MSICYWQRLWLRLGVNVDDQLWLHLNPIPIPNCNPSANPSPNTNPNGPTKHRIGHILYRVHFSYVYFNIQQ